MGIWAILSHRNVLRASGIYVLSIGVPMAVAPALAVTFFLGKRDATPEPDKKALDVALQAIGIALVGSGAKALVAPVEKCALATDSVVQALYSCYHIGNRVNGRWKDADGRMKANTAFCFTSVAVVTLQLLSLKWGDKEGDKNEEG